MKKQALTILAAIAVSGASFAQGYVNWTIPPSRNVIGETNTFVFLGLSAALGGGETVGGGDMGVTVAGSSSLFYYELMYSTVDFSTPTSLSDLANNWTATGLYMTNGVSGNGRLAVMNSSPAAEVDPSYTGGNIDLMLVGWSANLGSFYTGADGVLSELESWGASFYVDNAFFGESSVGSLAISTSAVAGSPIFGSSPGLIYNPSSSPMELYTLGVPEPGTTVLAVFGGALVFLLRRKK